MVKLHSSDYRAVRVQLVSFQRFLSHIYEVLRDDLAGPETDPPPPGHKVSAEDVDGWVDYCNGEVRWSNRDDDLRRPDESYAMTLTRVTQDCVSAALSLQDLPIDPVALLDCLPKYLSGKPSRFNELLARLIVEVKAREARAEREERDQRAADGAVQNRSVIISREEAARFLGVDQSTVWRMARGTNPRLHPIEGGFDLSEVSQVKLESVRKGSGARAAEERKMEQIGRERTQARERNSARGGQLS